MTQTTITPVPDEIDEIKVLQNNYDAKYSLMGAAVIVVRTKSGTSTFHGGAWEFVRNTVFDSRNFSCPPPRAYRPRAGTRMGGMLAGRSLSRTTTTRTSRGHFSTGISSGSSRSRSKWQRVRAHWLLCAVKAPPAPMLVSRSSLERRRLRFPTRRLRIIMGPHFLRIRRSPAVATQVPRRPASSDLVRRDGGHVGHAFEPDVVVGHQADVGVAKA